MDQLIAKMRWEKTSSMMMPPPMNKKVKVNIFVKILEKKTQLAHALIKLLKLLITKKSCRPQIFVGVLNERSKKNAKTQKIYGKALLHKYESPGQH